MDKSERTFVTRLEFIKSIFAEKYDQSTILAGSIQHKLDVAQDNYDIELQDSINDLEKRNAIKILKKIDKDLKNND